jgi:hypothetical protein
MSTINNTELMIDEDRLIRLYEAAKLLGLDADPSHTCRLAAAAGLTVVFTSHPMASRVTIRLLLSEVIQWGKRLGAPKGDVRTPYRRARHGTAWLEVRLPGDLSEEERLIPLAVGAVILGVSPDAISKATSTSRRRGADTDRHIAS